MPDTPTLADYLASFRAGDSLKIAREHDGRWCAIVSLLGEERRTAGRGPTAEEALTEAAQAAGLPVLVVGAVYSRACARLIPPGSIVVDADGDQVLRRRDGAWAWAWSDTDPQHVSAWRPALSLGTFRVLALDVDALEPLPPARVEELGGNP